jgi:hypothetical protein
MNKAALHATGDYILFMNAGDWFVADDAVSRPLAELPVEAQLDFLVSALGSLSWELTAPLRLPKRLLHRLRR